MEFITIPLVVGICVSGVYGLFELFARRKERLAIIEKIGDKIDASAFEGKLNFGNYLKNFSFSALKVGCLMAGIGFGLLVGFFINVSLTDQFIADHSWYYQYETAYGSSVLLFGGIALIVAFIIEMKLAKKK
jgi:hypothetical protein